MPQPKGSTGNPNGRPKGSANKVTTELRFKIQSFIDTNIDSLQKDFDTLEPKDRLQFFEKLLQYTLPKQQQLSTDFSRLSEEDLDEIISELKNSITDEDENDQIEED